MQNDIYENKIDSFRDLFIINNLSILSVKMK